MYNTYTLKEKESWVDLQDVCGFLLNTSYTFMEYF